MSTIKALEQLNNPELADFLKDSDLDLSNLQVHEGDLIIDGNYRLFEVEQEKSAIYITGDLIVSGTISIYFPTTDRRFLCVGGSIEAKNIINLGAFYFFVGGDLTIKNISFLGNALKKLNGEITTKVLITYSTYLAKIVFKNAYDFTSDDYLVFTKDCYGVQNGVTTFYFDRLAKKLENNEVCYDDKRIESRLNKIKEHEEWQESLAQEQEKIKTDKNYALFRKFQSALESEEHHNIELAGFVYINNEIQANILGLHPPDDQLLRDVRSRSGLYALIHADRPRLVKPNKRTKKGFEFKALDLLKRYLDLKHFFVEDNKMYYKHIFYSLGEQGFVNELYEKEKSYFTADKELGLYWLIVFGLLVDKRFDEVLKSISHFDWEMVEGAKIYFNHFKNGEELSVLKHEGKMSFLEQIILKKI